MVEFYNMIESCLNLKFLKFKQVIFLVFFGLKENKNKYIVPLVNEEL